MKTPSAVKRCFRRTSTLSLSGGKRSWVRLQMACSASFPSGNSHNVYYWENEKELARKANTECCNLRFLHRDRRVLAQGCCTERFVLFCFISFLFCFCVFFSPSSSPRHARTSGLKLRATATGKTHQPIDKKMLERATDFQQATASCFMLEHAVPTEVAFCPAVVTTRCESQPSSNEADTYFSGSSMDWR